MALPTASLVLDKPSYAPGEKITAILTYADTDNQAVTIAFDVTDAAGGKGSATASVVIRDPLTINMTQTGGRVWTKVSDDGSRAIYTATA